MGSLPILSRLIISQIGKAVGILLQKIVLITINYHLCSQKKLYLFILLYQMRRNYELGPILDSSSSSTNNTLRNNNGQTGTLPHYLYSNKISEFAETTEAYSADMVKVIWRGKRSAKTWLRNMKCPKWRAQRNSKQINLTLQVKMRMICFKHWSTMLPAWTKSLFSLSVVRQGLADQSRLIEDSSHNYVAIVTRATTEWTKKMNLKRLHCLIDIFFVSTL